MRERHLPRMIYPKIPRLHGSAAIATKLYCQAMTTRAPVEFDEALWVAYHRNDKIAVTENLIRRYLGRAVLLKTRPRRKSDYQLDSEGEPIGLQSTTPAARKLSRPSWLTSNSAFQLN
jgi:hypothetical protein